MAVELLELQLQKGEGVKLQWQKQVRYRLRLLGRFIIEARKIIPEAQSLNDILKCENFISIVQAAKECGQKGEGKAEGLSVPVKVGFVLKSAVEVILSAALRENNIEKMQNAKNLLRLYEMEWGTR